MMNNFDDFFEQRQTAAEAYVGGDPEPVDKLVPKGGNARFHSPTGESLSGAPSVAQRYRKDAALFHPGGKSRFEILQRGSSGDFGFWTGFQVATVRMTGHDEPMQMRIRVTEIFRRIDGEWKMIHRHADIGKTAG